jgi:hypothetical protein
MGSWFEMRGVAALLTASVVFSPPSAKRRGGVGGGGSIGRNRCFGERRATPTPDPSPPRAMRAGGGELTTSFC